MNKLKDRINRTPISSIAIIFCIAAAIVFCRVWANAGQSPQFSADLGNPLAGIKTEWGISIYAILMMVVGFFMASQQFSFLNNPTQYYHEMSLGLKRNAVFNGRAVDGVAMLFFTSVLCSLPDFFIGIGFYKWNRFMLLSVGFWCLTLFCAAFVGFSVYLVCSMIRINRTKTTFMAVMLLLLIPCAIFSLGTLFVPSGEAQWMITEKNTASGENLFEMLDPLMMGRDVFGQALFSSINDIWDKKPMDGALALQGVLSRLAWILLSALALWISRKNFVSRFVCDEENEKDQTNWYVFVVFSGIAFLAEMVAMRILLLKKTWDVGLLGGCIFAVILLFEAVYFSRKKTQRTISIVTAIFLSICFALCAFIGKGVSDKAANKVPNTDGITSATLEISAGEDAEGLRDLLEYLPVNDDDVTLTLEKKEDIATAINLQKQSIRATDTNVSWNVFFKYTIKGEDPSTYRANGITAKMKEDLLKLLDEKNEENGLKSIASKKDLPKQDSIQSMTVRISMPNKKTLIGNTSFREYMGSRGSCVKVNCKTEGTISLAYQLLSTITGNTQKSEDAPFIVSISMAGKDGNALAKPVYMENLSDAQVDLLFQLLEQEKDERSYDNILFEYMKSNCNVDLVEDDMSTTLITELIGDVPSFARTVQAEVKEMGTSYFTTKEIPLYVIRVYNRRGMGLGSTTDYRVLQTDDYLQYAIYSSMTKSVDLLQKAGVKKIDMSERIEEVKVYSSTEVLDAYSRYQYNQSGEISDGLFVGGDFDDLAQAHYEFSDYDILSPYSTKIVTNFNLDNVEAQKTASGEEAVKLLKKCKLVFFKQGEKQVAKVTFKNGKEVLYCLP